MDERLGVMMSPTDCPIALALEGTLCLVVVGDVVRCRELLAPSALAGVAITPPEQGDSLVEPAAPWTWVEATR